MSETISPQHETSMTGTEAVTAEREAADTVRLNWKLGLSAGLIVWAIGTMMGIVGAVQILRESFAELGWPIELGNVYYLFVYGVGAAAFWKGLMEQSP